jgi:hypothetical protein
LLTILRSPGLETTRRVFSLREIPSLESPQGT